MPLQLSLELDLFIVPHSDSVVPRPRRNQSEIMPVRAADYVLLVTMGLAAHDVLAGFLELALLVSVDLDDAIPTGSDDRVVFLPVADEGDLAVGAVVGVKLVGHDAREKVEDFELAQVVAHDQLSVGVVEGEAGDVRVEDVLEDSDGLASLGVPDFDRTVTREVELETDGGEEGTLDGGVV